MAEYEYDLVVIGGGSGGLAASKEAAKLGKKVACLDFVSPSPQGTTWGLGGTCVNVGCIPKKLMHQAGILGEGLSDAKEFGWKVTSEGLDWEKMVQGIQDHIGSTNFGYRVQLRDEGVTYINAKGAFTDPHTIVATKRNGKTQTITSEKFVIAVGGRPKYLGIEGDEACCLTSDDIFSKTEAPGKTLCIGASYISLETAGFLTALGYDTSVMCRSTFLRGFDQEISEQIVGYMERHGTKMLRQVVPLKFEKVDNKVKVTYQNTNFGFEASDTFDTVILAVGRDAVTKDMGLDKAGVEFDNNTGKITAVNEQTNVPHIYAIGDVLEARQELTPVAIKAGQRLVRRLYAGSKETMDYNLVPTTVFTPLEYGCVGMSEELAAETYGADNIEVYVSYFKPLEWATNHAEHENGVQHREDNACYAKLITNLQDNERVVGVHYLGPNAGEVTQGVAIAVKLGATKADFDNTVGIHPTTAEEFTGMTITKRSGKNAQKSGC